MLFLFNFGNIFVIISLNILNIELIEDLNKDKLKNFNIRIQIYLMFKREYKEFIIIKINLNIIKRNNKNFFIKKTTFISNLTILNIII